MNKTISKQERETAIHKIRPNPENYVFYFALNSDIIKIIKYERDDSND